jgi:peptidoglycan/LPS O-acetylase OafA/YrhL
MPLTPHLARRADIQSLRALAIGIVVAAHAHVPGLQGGYVGVDVFFVLSGYLISGLVLNEVASTGHFNAWMFYARRLKRLLPALLLVLISTAALGWLLSPPLQQKSQAAAGQSATLWLSNFWFSAREINYFSGGLGSNLFLHTWSLAVEEQFYIVWPWLLLFLYGVRRRQGQPMRPRREALGLILLAASSLLLSEHWSRTDLEAGFYQMPGRAWEFALGTLTFLLRRACEAGRCAEFALWRGRSLFNAVGGLFILLAATLYPDNLRYPGLWALLPCLGAALFLLDAPDKRPESPLSRLVLRQPVLQFLGNVSYSLYLWHWPIFVLGSQVFGNGVLVQISLAALALTLSAVTYYALENPLHRLTPHKPWKILALSALGMACGFLAMAIWQSATDRLLNGPEQMQIQGAKLDAPEIYQKDCDTWYRSADLSACVFGPAAAPHTVVMFGDSVLAQWYPAVAALYLKKPGWKVVVLTKSACSASQVSYYYDRIKALYTVCDLWRRRALDHIEQLRPDLIIMGSTRYGFSAEQWITGTRAVLDRLSPAAHSVAIMSPTPQLDFDGPDCLSSQPNLPHWLAQANACQTPVEAPSEQSLFATLTRAAQPYANVRVIDMGPTICPGGTCRARLGTSIVYRDKQHLTASFVRLIAPELQHALQTKDGRIESN